MPAGRPKSPHRRSCSLTVTLTPPEHKALQDEAMARRMTIANLVREKLGLETTAYTVSPKEALNDV